ncbi:MAG: hypothetical protein ACOC5T_07780 [Elusimicrobiota bacterium]
MKKLIFIIGMLLSSLVLTGQTRQEMGELFVDQVNELLEGVIVEKVEEEKAVYYSIKIDEVYDDLVISQTYRLVNSFDDVVFLRTWTEKESGISESAVLISPEEEYKTVCVMRYNSDANRLLIGYAHKDINDLK